MISEEEKKAIKDCDIIFINLDDMMSEESANQYRTSYRIIKKLIEEQQNEIEDLKIKNKKIQEINYRVNKNLVELAETSISKDEIREKIEELEENIKKKRQLNIKEWVGFEENEIEILEELLEE